MKLKELKRLKRWYNRYQHFWLEWREYKFNGFSKKDILIIELYRDHNFIIDVVRLEVFYDMPQIVDCLERLIVRKFRQNYMEYKKWVVTRFFGFIIKKAINYGLEDYLTTPIKRLKIETTLKNSLLTFNCKNILGILEQYSDSDFLKNDLFDKILKFRSVIPDRRLHSNVNLKIVGFS